jgi:hypothetical protein
MMMTVYELSSASGATAMFLAMLLLSLGISLSLYAVIVRYSSRRALFQGWHTFPPFAAAILCTAVFGLLFKVMHVTTLQGFYRVELLDSEVRLHSLFPPHTVTLPRGEFAQAEGVSTHLGLGYLRLRTGLGTPYESVLTSEGAVRESWEGLNAYLGCSGPPEHPGGEVERIAQDSASGP